MEDKKEYILKKAGEMYFKFGIKSVTMDDVASELGISKKTLYQHFKDKAGLISQVIDFYVKNPQFCLNNVENGNAIDGYFAFRSHIIYVLKYFHNTIEYDLKKLYPKLYMKVHKMKRENIFSNTFENLKKGISEDLYRSDLDVEVIAKLQVGRMLLTLNPENEIFTEREVANIELFDKVIEYHMHAVCTEKGIKYFKQQLNNVRNDVQN
ncbi:MAG: TetR/AcrR family transcriptional regulator [Bacteroidales bacterium]|nr:TetR/AcrR family transcriptional regulator [Bacteroidales bacterium]